MEIHPPTRPIESAKDFLLHLFMIVLGILIALGLEQAVEAWHHHEMGVEARENILQEIRDNQKEIAGEHRLIEKNKEDMQHTLQVVRQFLAHQKLKVNSMSLSVNNADLNSTSWTTAGATGALGYMGYAEAKRFARAYEIQELLQHVQEDRMRSVVHALTPVNFSGNGPDSMTDEQLREVERGVLDCLAQASQWEQLAAQLDDEYSRVLKAK